MAGRNGANQTRSCRSAFGAGCRQNAHTPSRIPAAPQPTVNPAASALRTIRSRSAPDSRDTWASRTLPTNSRFRPSTRYPRPIVSRSCPARGSGWMTSTASSVVPASAAAITTWSTRPAATQRAPRIATLAAGRGPRGPGRALPGRRGRSRGRRSRQARLGRRRDRDDQEQPVDQRERNQYPDRPAGYERDREGQYGHHGAVVADQLDRPYQRGARGHQALRGGTLGHHRGDQVDHPGTRERGDEPYRHRVVRGGHGGYGGHQRDL